MTFSLITATLGRTEEIRILCDSLSKQTFKDFELYIVDQNEHHLIENIVKEFEPLFTIHYIRNIQKGLSLNRNIALRITKGDIIGFPDDDCYYAPDTLEKVYYSFNNNPQAIFVATSTYDNKSKRPRHSRNKLTIQKKDVLECCISYNIFVRRNSTLFDERLGVGTYFSSGEETDYLYAQLNNKYSFGIFCPEASVFHPSPSNSLKKTKEFSSKVYKYSLGFAALQKKDWLERHNNSALVLYLFYLLRAFCGMLLIKDFTLHWQSFKGKIVGFIKFKV